MLKVRKPNHKGDAAEQTALAFLLNQGCQLVTRNFSCKAGEIDLIVKDGDDLVFVEVRHRANNRFGGASESVDYFKQCKLRTTAEVWLQNDRTETFIGCRFDVIAISGIAPNQHIDWIADAF